MTTPTYTIRPFSTRILPDFRELWRYRELAWSFAMRDIQLRYRQTLLGVLWVIIQPLFASGIFTFVFGRVARLDSAGLPYFLIAFTGFTTYQVFQSALSKAGGSLLAHAHVLTKVYMPRLVVPLSGLLSTALDFTVSLAFFAFALAYYHITPTLALLAIPFWIAMALAIGLGLGLVAAAWSLRYRDVQIVLPVLLQLLLYATPVAYLTSVVPARLRPLIALNPLTAAVDGMRWSLLGQPAPSPAAVAWLVACSALALVAGLVVFNRFEKDLADVV